MNIVALFRELLVRPGTVLSGLVGQRVYFRRLPSNYDGSQKAIRFQPAGGETAGGSGLDSDVPVYRYLMEVDCLGGNYTDAWDVYMAVQQAVVGVTMLTLPAGVVLRCEQYAGGVPENDEQNPEWAVVRATFEIDGRAA